VADEQKQKQNEEQKMALRKNNPPSETAPETTAPKTRLRKPAASTEEPKAQKAAPAPEPEPVEPELMHDNGSDPEMENTTAQVKSTPERAMATRVPPKPPAVGGSLGIVSPLNQLENQIPPGELEFGSIPRYTASNGQILNSDKKSIGTWAQFEPVSFNDLYMLAPGANDDEAKDYLKFSYDGEICTDGATTMEAALQDAKSAGYKDASVKKYVELFGILLSGEKLPDGSPELGKLVMFSLSPQSVKKWNGFKVQSAVSLKMRRIKEEDMKVVTAEVLVQTFGDNTFSCFDFSL
jgi:hypothetical protein